ncbi:MAG TPA: tRNA epoxyqueuosine(34) reductase QueG [Terriglobia bacterium]|nr:tRNA epoxyqueuosine(34) reductase QueG [Terriglobia bacterium]
MRLAETIKRLAIEIGFDLVGIAPLDVAGDLGFARRWFERGYAGTMQYLGNPKRDDLRCVLPSAQSVVCVGLVYNTGRPYSTEIDSGRGGLCPPATANDSRAWISRYAWGRDYHEVMRGKLERLRSDIEDLAPGVETRIFVDTGPVVERALARYSGIGWMGKNTCLINEGKGSWFFLGVILTSLALAPDQPAPDRCGSCTRCLEACPTGALVEPYVMDASRCISYFTIELRGSIPAEFRPAMGANVFGCDICQDVCPWNSPQQSALSGQRDVSQKSEVRSQEETGREAIHERRTAALTASSEFQPMGVEAGGAEGRSFSLFNPRLDDLASLTEEDFRRVFAHSPIKRTKYRGWLRNLCVAVGNSGDRRFLPRLERLAQHDDPVVREHAQWALGQLQAVED